MSEQAGAVSELVQQLGRLPGIGRKSAERLAFHLLRVSEQEALALGRIDPSSAAGRTLLRHLFQPVRIRYLPDLRRSQSGLDSTVRGGTTARFDELGTSRCV